MRKQLRASKVLSLLKAEYPDATVSLYYNNAHELLFAVILSAQCTDERVNSVTPMLYKKYPALENYANAKLTDIENIIKSTGFYRQKAKSIRDSARILISDYSGSIPKTIRELILLPGVGRKTANVVLSTLYNENQGIVVDTHVRRLSLRIGLTKSKNPVIIEQDLMKLYHQKDYGMISLLLIMHGRSICNARKPKCGNCIIYDHCNYERKDYYKRISL